MSIVSVQAVDALIQQIQGASVAGPSPAKSFADLLAQGIDRVDTRVARADRLVAAAAVDPSLPLHQVTFALEEARISLEVMIQIRNRLIDASQQLLNLQL